MLCIISSANIEVLLEKRWSFASKKSTFLAHRDITVPHYLSLVKVGWFKHSMLCPAVATPCQSSVNQRLTAHWGCLLPITV